MRTRSDVESLLSQLDSHTADELEDQDLDFKEWIPRSMDDSVRLVVEMAICMANGGGGTVVFGVDDDEVGRGAAIIGVPAEVDVNRLRKAVYDSTDPKITPVFEELLVPEGSGRLLIMQVYPGMPPHTDTAGRAKIRVGKECQPLTGTMRRRIAVEAGENDFTRERLPGPVESYLSPAAIEHLRGAARHEQAPADLLTLDDLDLLKALGVVRDGQISRAGVLLAGKREMLEEHCPAYAWTYLKMQSDTAYTDRVDGREAIPVALSRLTERIMADNPISTLHQGLFHFEYRTYPEIALREALLNAFGHADFRLASPVIVKHHAAKIEITNPGGFVGGVTPNNILHHAPVARNPSLIEPLTRLRLVNRSNLGIPRMFTALLVEGKEPPVIEEQGDAVKITFLARELSGPFRVFVAEETRRGRFLAVDHLLVLLHLLRHRELDTATAARVCQRAEADVRETLSVMERGWEYLDRGGTGRGTYWTLRRETHARLSGPGDPDRDRRLDWEAAKTRVLSVLKQRAESGESGLSNAEIRQITYLDRHQVVRLMSELRRENGMISEPGRGRHARYSYVPMAPGNDRTH